MVIASPVALRKPTFLKVPAHTVLIPAGAARVILGVDADAIKEMMECGQIRWSWNISATQQIRAVRLWVKELESPVQVANLNPQAVVDAVIGTQRDRLAGRELCQILACSRPHIKRLVDAGFLSGRVERRVLWVTRSAFAEFLAARMEN